MKSLQLLSELLNFMKSLQLLSELLRNLCWMPTDLEEKNCVHHLVVFSIKFGIYRHQLHSTQLSSYRAVNTFRLSYTNQSLNVV